MCKKLFFSLIAIALIATSARAADDILSGNIDLASVRDADNTVVEPTFNVDVDASAQKTTDKNDEAVEVCWRSYNCCYRPCYNYCYSSCYYPCYSYNYCYYPTYSYCYYPSYSYCYYPTYSYCYTPVTYGCSYGYSSWGCW